MLPDNTIEAIRLWFHRAVPNPDEKNVHVQLGCHLEEFVEMLEAVTPLSPRTVDLLEKAKEANRNLADYLKQTTEVVMIHPNDRVEYLDAICDQLVTLVGCAHMSELDIVGASDEVNLSNWSKFDEQGQPIFNEHGKIAKGPRYRAPELTDFAA